MNKVQLCTLLLVAFLFGEKVAPMLKSVYAKRLETRRDDEYRASEADAYRKSMVADYHYVQDVPPLRPMHNDHSRVPNILDYKNN